jgi:hypothetical protein
LTHEAGTTIIRVVNLLRNGGNSGVAALTADASTVRILALMLSVLLLSLGLLLGSTLAAG